MCAALVRTVTSRLTPLSPEDVREGCGLIRTPLSAARSTGVSLLLSVRFGSWLELGTAATG